MSDDELVVQITTNFTLQLALPESARHARSFNDTTGKRGPQGYIPQRLKTPSRAGLLDYLLTSGHITAMFIHTLFISSIIRPSVPPSSLRPCLAIPVTRDAEWQVAAQAVFRLSSNNLTQVWNRLGASPVLFISNFARSFS